VALARSPKKVALRACFWYVSFGAGYKTRGLSMNLPTNEKLYDRFVKGLESKHRGAFVAVHPDGRVVVDKDDIRVVDEALKQFGPGNFVLLKIGSKGVGKWRRQRPL
jgi:hypothetical protein